MRNAKYYMLTVIIWIVIAIIASATSAAHGANVSRETLPTITMSATSWAATPTPIVSEPVIMTEFVWLPVVMGGGE